MKSKAETVGGEANLDPTGPTMPSSKDLWAPGALVEAYFVWDFRHCGRHSMKSCRRSCV